jgi:excisionase family DNA binding protein
MTTAKIVETFTRQNSMNDLSPRDAIHHSATTATFLPERLLDSEETAALMKIHPKTLQKLARKGVVRGIHIGKLWRFRASAIEAWIESQ